MKIATNVHQDAFGGITISNLALFDWLEDKDVTIVGVEYVNARHFLGAFIFRHYLPSFFRHHIINGIDIMPNYSWETIRNPRKQWGILIETTKEILRNEAPDIVLINGTYSFPWILAQAAHELGIPIVLRYAGILQKEITNKGYFVRKRLLVYERWIGSVAHAIIFPSTLCRKVVEREILCHPVKSGVVIPNPVTLKEVPRAHPKRKARYIIAAIGRWTAIKNFQAFLALHTSLQSEKWPHRAIMVTSYWDEKFGIPETIERRSSMSQEDLRAFYRSIDLLVVPSHFETFCNVAAEALVHGCSVLVSENVGIADVLRKSGLSRMIIPSFDDPAVVVAAVKRLAQAPLTKKEQRSIASILNPQGIHEDIIDVLERVLRGEPLRSKL